MDPNKPTTTPELTPGQQLLAYADGLFAGIAPDSSADVVPATVVRYIGGSKHHTMSFTPNADPSVGGYVVDITMGPKGDDPMAEPSISARLTTDGHLLELVETPDGLTDGAEDPEWTQEVLELAQKSDSKPRALLVRLGKFGLTGLMR